MQSPFTGLNSAALEVKNLFSNGWKVFSVIAITLIPLVYAGLFLLAFLDPYGSLSNVPAAVVNLDSGAAINDEQRNIGQELCDSLIENNENAKEGEASGYKWQFVDDVDAAYEGLEDGTYYMLLVIPEDFSENIGSAGDTNPQHAELQAYFNPSTNLIAQTVGSSMVTSIKAQMNEKVSEEYVNNIFMKITDASDTLVEAVDGANELADGLADAQDGSNTITVNLGTLAEGADTLTSGLTTLANGAASLDSGLDQLESGATQVDSGAGELESGGETLASGASELTSGAASLDSGIGQIASGLGTLNSGTGQYQDGITTLDNGLTTLSDGASKLAAGTKTLADNAGTLQDGATKLTSGINTLDSKSKTLTDGSSQIASGLKQLADGSKAFNDGITAAMTNAQTSGMDVNTAKATYASALAAYAANPTTENMAALNNAVTALASASGNYGAYSALSSVQSSYTDINNGISSLNTNYTAINSGITSYTSGVSTLKEGANQLSTGVKTAVEGIDALNTGAASVAEGAASAKAGSSQLNTSFGEISAGVNTLAQGAQSAKSGSSALSSGLNTAASGIDTLLSGMVQLKDGTSSLLSGTQSASSGAHSLSTGAQSAQSGSAEIADGAKQLEEGSETLTEGIETAKDGSQTLADGLDEGQQSLAESTENADAKADVISAPVEANGDTEKGESITQVSNYGTGFAPYFIGLGMWVGCLMISFLLRSLNNRILMTRSYTFSAVLSSYLPMLLIAVVQVLLLLATIQFVLGFSVNFPLEYYLFGLLTAACFVAIIQFFRSAFGTAGMVIIVILLMLQLCTAAGTFPIEAEIDFFNVLNPVLPMTYVVRGFRMAMCGLSTSYMVTPSIVLAAFTVGFLALTTLVAQMKRRVSMSTLYPKIKMVG